MTLLDSLRHPADLRELSPDALDILAAEIRRFVVEAVSRTGGHLGPNLGVVELTLALHRVFDSPHDKILFDTGHQAYVHKLLTGRAARFSTLRKSGGLSGYPNREESEHDVIENSHASTALSYADGLAKAFALRGEKRCVVAVVGDGALTGGMCWEALNNIAGAPDRPLVIVVNDNGRSYAPTVGGLANRLSALRLSRGYERMLATIKARLNRTPVVGPPLYDALHGAKRGLKDFLTPQGLFEDLGLKYVGPIDGHNIAAVETALRRAKRFGGPVIVHCVTRKGFGYRPAELDEADCLHGPGAFDPATGKPTGAPAPTWTRVFSEEMLAISAERPEVVAITAAMLQPVGLKAFAEAHPERVFDVGIAEQHAVTSAAGLAMGGMHPVVAVYATFLNRAFDQVLMDVALHRLPVTFVLDRAGVTGEDGPSHHGMWDLSVLRVVPGLRIAAPRDSSTLRAELREALDVHDGPTALRFPKGSLAADLPAVRVLHSGLEVLHEADSRDVLVVSVGPMASVGVAAAELVAGQGIGVTVVDPRWVLPVSADLVRLAASYDLVAVVEDNTRSGGVGCAVAEALREAGVHVPVRTFAIPPEFLAQGTRVEVLQRCGLTPSDVAAGIVEALEVNVPGSGLGAFNGRVNGAAHQTVRVEEDEFRVVEISTLDLP
jgi:1-deoxy-D-xylulose-5-phosphate synthase